MLTPILNVHAASSAHYYAGYYYYGDSSSPRWGVKGNVMTIWAERNIGEICAEWVDVVLDYAPAYWIQCGYVQYWIYWIIPVMSFYIEKQDALGHQIIYLDQLTRPIEGHIYSYAIWHDTVHDRWRYAIMEGSLWLYANWRNVYPDQPIDLQAFVETTHTSANIDGSHFSKLNYWDPGISWWPFWNRHVPWVSPDSPYSLNEISHYEFYASGGG